MLTSYAVEMPRVQYAIRNELVAAGDVSPRLGHVHTCSLCRLELVLNEQGSQMTVAHLLPERPPKRQPT